jgi:NADH:ubiquinone reductase (H+-translocating)
MAGFERLSVDSGDLDVTVVGGGATGVELAGTLAELRGTVLGATFPDVDASRVHVRLVEMAPSLLGPFHEKLRDYAKAQLLARDVDVRLNTKISEVTANQVRLADGEDLPSDITVWAAGVAASRAVEGWGLPQGKNGRIVVGPDLRVQGQDRIFAVGDIAVNPDDPTPQLAQPALQMGRHAAMQIVKLESKTATEPFKYHDKGIMATIGRRSAVVQLAGGLRMRGTLAWLAWLALHLVYLLGGRNRVSTLINLTYRYVFWGHGGAVIVGDEPSDPDPGSPESGSPGASSERGSPELGHLRPTVGCWRDEQVPRARRAVSRGLAWCPRRAGGHFGAGRMRYRYAGRLTVGERAVRRAGLRRDG